MSKKKRKLPRCPDCGRIGRPVVDGDACDAIEREDAARGEQTPWGFCLPPSCCRFCGSINHCGEENINYDIEYRDAEVNISRVSK